MAYVAKPVEEKDEMGIWRLQELIRATCLRRTKQKTLASGALDLPHRSERVELVHLHPDDQALYEAIKMTSQRTAAGLGKSLRVGTSAKEKQDNVMVLLNSLRLICNHGKELVPHLSKDKVEYNSISKQSRAKQHMIISTCSSCGGETSGSSGSSEVPDSLCVSCGTLEAPLSHPHMKSEPEGKQSLSPFSPTRREQSSLATAVRPSAKVSALIKNLRHESSISSHKKKGRKRYISLLGLFTMAQNLFLHNLVLYSVAGLGCLI